MWEQYLLFVCLRKWSRRGGHWWLRSKGGEGLPGRLSAVMCVAPGVGADAGRWRLCKFPLSAEKEARSSAVSGAGEEVLGG